MPTNISKLKVKKVSQLLDLPIDIQPKDALLMVATLTDNYKISINNLLSGVNTTILNNAKIALQNLIDYSNNVNLESSNSNLIEIEDKSITNSNGIKYPKYKLNIKEAVISNYGEIENKDGIITGAELEKLANHLSLKDSELEMKINEISNKIDDIDPESGVSSEEINNINNKINTLEENINNSNYTINLHEEKISNLELNVSQIIENEIVNNEKLTNIENNINEINDKFDNITLSSNVTTLTSEDENVIINYQNNENLKETSYTISLKMSSENENGIITKNEVTEMIKNIKTNLSWEIK